MPAFSFLHVCLVLLSVVRSDIECSSRPITCDAGTFVFGESASVSCNLHANMNACKLSVSVVHYRPNAPVNDPGKEIVSCQWVEAKNDHKCRVENGYKFSDEVEDHPVLRIPVVNNQTAGFYMCYVMPSKDTTTHVCKLTPTAKRVPRTTFSASTSLPTEPPGQRCETNSRSPHLLVGVVILATLLIIVLVLVSILHRDRIKRLLCKGKAKYAGDLEMAVRESLISGRDGNGNSVVQQTGPHTNKKIEALVKSFRLGASDYERMMTLLAREMNEERMPRTTVKSLSNGGERGDCLVAVLGSSTLKIVLIKIQGQNIDSRVTESHKITTAIRKGTGDQLLQFITRCINDFLRTHNLSGQTMNVGFVLSFPCKHDQEHEQDLTRVQLIRWTKEFDCSDLVGKQLGVLLHEALRKITVCDLQLKVVVNDVVDMLVSAASGDPSCKIALVLGDGVNACYSRNENNEYITTEFGSCWDSGCLDLYRTDFDIDLDRNSVNKQQQVLEKMMSLMYLGELVRLVLVKLAQEKLLFTSLSWEVALYQTGSFKTDFIPLVDRDTDGNFKNTEFVLGQLEVENFTGEDCRTVQYVCRLISERAAHLAAAVLAVIIRRVGQPAREITVAVHESLDKNHSRIYQLMLAKTRELVGDDYKFNINTLPNESGKGAAILAAAT